MKKLSLEDERQLIKSAIIALVGVFFIVYAAVPFFYFFSAPVKSTAPATLIESKMGNSVGDGGVVTKKFVYTLKWEFDYEGRKYRCTTTEKSSQILDHSVGEKKRLFAYSSDGVNFKKVKIGVRTVVIPVFGLLCIGFVIWDLISYKRYKNETEEEDEDRSLYTIMSNTK